MQSEASRDDDAVIVLTRQHPEQEDDDGGYLWIAMLVGLVVGIFTGATGAMLIR